MSNRLLRGMPVVPLSERIVQVFDTLPDQLKLAARYVLKHPDDVALLSMREQARQAGIQPATMTRLAKHLGYSGYEEFRRIFADAMRDVASGFSGKLDLQAETQKLQGDHSLAAAMVGAIATEISGLSDPGTLDRLVEAAQLIERARRVYCLGLRSSYSTAWHLHYTLSLAGKHAIMIDTAGGIGADPLGSATPQDVLISVSVLPYTRQTIEFTEYAQKVAGVPVVAITDSPVAPLTRKGTVALIVSTDSPSFLHSMCSAFSVAEILGALVAGRGGEVARRSLERLDRQAAMLKTHYEVRDRRQ
jgi:DNA-binding MurR/RpiR family transcriptional regulator